MKKINENQLRKIIKQMILEQHSKTEKYELVVFLEGSNQVYLNTYVSKDLKTAQKWCQFVANQLVKLLPGEWSVGLLDYDKYVKKGNEDPIFTAVGKR